jgi:hypothetical protein
VVCGAAEWPLILYTPGDLPKSKQRRKPQQRQPQQGPAQQHRGPHHPEPSSPPQAARSQSETDGVASEGRGDLQQQQQQLASSRLGSALDISHPPVNYPVSSQQGGSLPGGLPQAEIHRNQGCQDSLRMELCPARALFVLDPLEAGSGMVEGALQGSGWYGKCALWIWVHAAALQDACDALAAACSKAQQARGAAGEQVLGLWQAALHHLLLHVQVT